MQSNALKSPRVLLVDDHEIVRAGLRLVLTSANIEVVGEASSVSQALTAVHQYRPDIVLLDVRLPDGSGVDACREIRATYPDTRVLFLTAFEDEDALLATGLAHADGYLLKEIGSEKLVQAIRASSDGFAVIDPVSKHRILERVRTHLVVVCDVAGHALSEQERRVLELVAEGKTNKEIAQIMRLSPKTVKNYLSHVFQKLQVKRRSEAAARFARTASAH